MNLKPAQFYLLPAAVASSTLSPLVKLLLQDMSQHEWLGFFLLINVVLFILTLPQQVMQILDPAETPLPELLLTTQTFLLTDGAGRSCVARVCENKPNTE